MGRFKLADIPTCIGYFRVPAEPKADGDLGRPRTAKMQSSAAATEKARTVIFKHLGFTERAKPPGELDLEVSSGGLRRTFIQI